MRTWGIKRKAGLDCEATKTKLYVCYKRGSGGYDAGLGGGAMGGASGQHLAGLGWGRGGERRRGRREGVLLKRERVGFRAGGMGEGVRHRDGGLKGGSRGAGSDLGTRGGLWCVWSCGWGERGLGSRRFGLARRGPWSWAAAREARRQRAEGGV